MTYYLLTTVSTVGFGDFYPITNNERISWTVILMFGSMMFSYILSSFVDSILKSRDIFFESSDDFELHRFFMLLKKFNYNTPVDTTEIKRFL